MSDNPPFGTDQDDDFALDPTADQADPLDLSQEARRLVTQPYDLSVQTLASDVDKGRLILSEVPYQREYVWDDSKASRLVESLLLNVPIPVCYFAENADGTLEVIDGQQRIRSIRRFLANEFPLRGIPVLAEIEGKRFQELSERDQRRIANRTIRCIVITEDSHPDIKFDVFERLNTGSVMLTAQELRNCIYRGPFNDALKSTASADMFLAALGRSTDRRNHRMAEEELVLRFLALIDRLDQYKAPMRQFLNSYMRENRNKAPKKELLDLLMECSAALCQVFDGHAFYGFSKEGMPGRNINRALFDAILIPVAHADLSKLVAAKDQVRVARTRLLKRENFQAMIGRATADTTRVMGRIQAFNDELRQLRVTTWSVPSH